MKSSVKYITVTLETESGLQVRSTYCYPKYRKKRNPKSLFKEMEKDPVKWFKKQIDFL